MCAIPTLTLMISFSLSAHTPSPQLKKRRSGPTERQSIDEIISNAIFLHGWRSSSTKIMVHNDGQRTKKKDPFQPKPPMDAFPDNTMTIILIVSIGASEGAGNSCCLIGIRPNSGLFGDLPSRNV
jgi:hypothetical protein